MTPKKILTTILLLFAAGSAAYVLLGGQSGRSHDNGNTGAASGSVDDESLGKSDDLDAAEPALIVYYMDMGKDCTTCLQLENYTYETLETRFTDELAKGKISWRTVDLDNPANEHFIAEFGLYTKSIVLVRPGNGASAHFESLSRIWELVYDKEAYMAYIQEQVQTFLDETGAPA